MVTNEQTSTELTSVDSTINNTRQEQMTVTLLSSNNISSKLFFT